MKGAVLSVFVLVVLFLELRPAAAAVYRLVDYPDDQNGWHLSGEITTDGTIGALANSNLTSWIIVVTRPGYYLDWFYPERERDDVMSGLVATTNGELVLPDPIGITAPDNWMQLRFHDTSGYFNFNWDRSAITADTYAAGWEVGEVFWSGQNPSMGGGNPWVIARIDASPSSVPEPSTIAVLAGFWLIGLYQQFRPQNQRKRLTFVEVPTIEIP